MILSKREFEQPRMSWNSLIFWMLVAAQGIAEQESISLLL